MRTKNCEREQLTEKNVSKLMADAEGQNINNKVGAFIWTMSMPSFELFIST